MIDLKILVKEKYGDIAKSESGSCCGTSCCDSTYTTFSESYDGMTGYSPDADLGLGCGLPTEYAGIHSGDTVADLGSGAGNDCFVARALVGDSGQVIGVDMTEEMVARARDNAKRLGTTNVEFRLGDIEELPLESSSVDVVISNCVLNLVPDKAKAFSEIRRVLKPGGHFSISDVVLRGSLPAPLLEAAELYAGCVSGALPMEEYLEIIRSAGFTDIAVRKEKAVQLPVEILSKFLDANALAKYQASGVGIFSITVNATAP